MVPSIRPRWPLSRICASARPSQIPFSHVRSVSAGTLRYRTSPRPLPPPAEYRTKEAMKLLREQNRFPEILPAPRRFKVHPPPGRSAKKICPEPLNAWNAAQLGVLDPTNARTRLFSKDNEDGARVGDVLMVRFKSGDPFAGICMNIRRRGVDTAILLRNQLTRVGTELWVKIYSPTVTGIEIVERRLKRARRARLYYFRKPKHDRGSLDGLVERYVKTKLATGRGVGTRVKNKGPVAGAKAKEGRTR